MTTKLIVVATFAALTFTACDKNETTTTNIPVINPVDSTNTGNETPATKGILTAYDGTYNVTGTGHTRGTVIISNNGTRIDFDNGIAYDIDDKNVYDRISTFNRYQIEVFDSSNAQDRIRINLDPTDKTKVVGFEFDKGADEKDIISVTISSAGTTSETATKSSYTFADDNIECTPFSSNPSINAQGILSVVSNKCQGSGSKLDGYFKYGSRPTAGTYTIKGTAGNLPDILKLSPTEYGFVFYGHASETWYSTAGTITLTTNTSDSTKLDMIWKDVTMTSADGTKTVKFSGTLLAL